LDPVDLDPDRHCDARAPIVDEENFDPGENPVGDTTP
jgi:hypothetical protein